MARYQEAGLKFYKICISKATATGALKDSTITVFYKICISKATATFYPSTELPWSFYKICISKATATCRFRHPGGHYSIKSVSVRLLQRAGGLL